MSPVEWRDAYEREQRRAATDRAIVAEQLAPNLQTLLHWINRCVDEHGAIWKGAERLADELGWSATWVYVLLRRACEAGHLVQVERGGGCHRTSTFALKVGHWRDDARSATMHHDWAERRHAILLAVLAWREQLFAEHLDGDRRCCWRFAPREMKQPPIAWVT